LGRGGGLAPNGPQLGSGLAALLLQTLGGELAEPLDYSRPVGELRFVSLRPGVLLNVAELRG
tara:strand:- start:348 stop:533 length:186 start_codon:yes stop_codon:yes gene_type:complete